MDRISRIGTLVCVLLLVYLFYYNATHQPKLRPKPVTTTEATTPGATVTGTPVPVAPAGATNVVAAPVAPAAEQLGFLENDPIKVTLSSLGATVKEVELKGHKAGDTGHVVLNEDAHSGILQLGGWPGADTVSFAPTPGNKSLSYTATLSNGVKWQRDYSLGANYALSVKDTLTNTGTGDVTLPLCPPRHLPASAAAGRKA